jgi:ribosomal protein S20
MNLNNKPDPISKLYLKLSRENNSKAFHFSKLISDFEADVTIRTNDIERVKDASNKDNITILTDRNDFNSAVVYSYEDAKEMLVNDFESLLNNFIKLCKGKLGEEYSDDIEEIMNIFSLMSEDDVFRNENRFSGLEGNIKNIVKSVEKIKNDNKGKRIQDYGTNSSEIDTGSSKEIIKIKDDNKASKRDGGGFLCAAVAVSIAAIGVVCHATLTVGERCTNCIGRSVQNFVLGR